MNDNLLVALSKYRPREGHTPLENFITESFAWFLRNNREFSSEFFRRFCNLSDNAEIKSVDTQVSLSGTYPDMLVQTQSGVFIFEHKTFTPLSPNQLGKYRELGNLKYSPVRIVLITGTKAQHEQNPDIALTWLDVYHFVNEVATNLPSSTFLRDFSELLKEHGLGPQPALSHESMISYLPSKNFLPDLQSILWKVHEAVRIGNISRILYVDEPSGIDRNIKWNYNISRFWGRVGTEYLRVWRPGIFVGCIVDNKDHANSYTDCSKGIDFCLILSFDQESVQDENIGECYGLIDYEHDPIYRDLLLELQSSIEQLDGYELYNHLVEQEPNRWHPLYLRKPLSEVLKGCETQEEQVARLVRDSEKLVGFLVNSHSFQQLREKYRVGS